MNYKNFVAIAAALTFAVVSFGCGGAANTTTTTTTTNKNANSTTTTTTTTTNTAANTAANSTTTASTGDIGVPECDEYIKKYEACLLKVSAKAPQAEAPLKAAFQSTRDGWKKAAETPGGKSALATGCKAALDQAKSNPALGAYACEW
jgi:hypothetical protein